MFEWQPIETAPKDGKDLILWAYLGGGQRRYVTAYWNAKRWIDTVEGADTIAGATHWMRPEPPIT